MAFQTGVMDLPLLGQVICFILSSFTFIIISKKLLRDKNK